jgi:hypothetical protein
MTALSALMAVNRPGVAQVTAHHVDELCVTLGGPDRGGMANRPQ